MGEYFYGQDLSECWSKAEEYAEVHDYVTIRLADVSRFRSPGADNWQTRATFEFGE